MLRLTLSLLCLLLTSCGPAYIPDYKDITARANIMTAQENSLHPRIRCYSGVKRVDNIVERLAITSDTYNWCVQVKEGDWNASVDQRRNIVVQTGLLNDVKNDSELAAVIGHEIGHAIFRHPEKTLEAKKSFQSIERSILQNSRDRSKAQLQLAIAKLIHQTLVEKPFSRQQEYEADTYGMYLVMQSDYDPGSAISIWYRRHKLSGHNKKSDFMDTHPLNSKRVVNFFRALASFYKSK